MGNVAAHEHFKGKEDKGDGFTHQNDINSSQKVLLIAPSGLVDIAFLKRGCNILQSWGLELTVKPQVYEAKFTFAGSDESRAQAVIESLQDPSFCIIICAKGGAGCTRILPLLEKSKLSPSLLEKKRVFGFSDVTALHCFFQKISPGLISFHSPMPATSFFCEGTKMSQQALKNAIFANDIHVACPPLQGKVLQVGKAAKFGGKTKGRLIGGNLTVLTSLLGTPWQPDFRGCVLFLEDDNEPMYKVDRMFTHLVQATGGNLLLEELAALALGNFTNSGIDFSCDSKFWLDQLGLPGSVPVLAGLSIGHTKDNRVLPIGATVEVELIGGVLKVA